MSQFASPTPPLASDAPAVGVSTAQNSEETRVNALTLRGLVIGLICIVATCFVVTYAELVVGAIQIGYLQLPPVVVGLLVVLLAAQGILTRVSKRLQLEKRELFTIYTMMLLASMISSRGLMEKLLPLLVVPNYFATPENNWQGLFGESLKKYSLPFDTNGAAKQTLAVRFFESLRYGEQIPWKAWIAPLLVWGVFVGLIFFAFLCLAVILRRQWADNEKLSFPLAQLPREMIRGESVSMRGTVTESFLKNRLTWIGFALPAFYFGLSGLHQLAPSFPDVTTDIDLNAFFATPPYNAMGPLHLYLSFAAVGFFYLLPTDLLFSLWFFFLLGRFQEVTAAAMGYEPEGMPMYPCKMFVGYQAMGAYVVLVGYMIYAARPHLKRVWLAAIGRARNAFDSGADELIPYRTAFWGLIISTLLSAGWMALMGMSYWLALFEIGVMLFVVALVLARSTSESGMLMTETSFRPVDMLRMVMDVRNLSPANQTGLAFLDGLWLRDMRGLVLTGFLDSMKLADGVRVKRRSLLGVFGIAVAASLVCAAFAQVYYPYHQGGVTMYYYAYQGNPVWAFNDAATSLNHSKTPLAFVAPASFGVGVAVTMALATLRTRLMWFPLHPLGYALAGSWTMVVFWFGCFMAWLFKTLILRYGGMRLYALARPFFLGMVLGEFTSALLWTLPALFYRSPLPAFPWK